MRLKPRSKAVSPAPPQKEAPPPPPHKPFTIALLLEFYDDLTNVNNRRLYTAMFLFFVVILSLRDSSRVLTPLALDREYLATHHGTFGPPGTMRVDWTNLPVQSQLAKELYAHQRDCKKPLKYFQPRNNAGLGSDLHVYGMALCAAHRYRSRMFAANPWMYWDETVCDPAIAKGEIPKSESSMSCYFPSLELPCPNDQQRAQQIYNESLKGNTKQRVSWEAHEDQACHSLLKRPGYSNLFKIYDVRAAITELQFSQVSSIVMKEAQRQHALVFPNGVPPSHQLISCHVRWGDKGSEMALQPIPTYIHAIQKIARIRNLAPHEVHVFLATEDPRAVIQFKAAMHPAWTVYIDQFYVEMLPHRNNQTMEVAGAAREGFGKTGLLALGSLLVTMESDSYVLSTGSNWSRMMNELRKAVLSPRKCPSPRGIAPDIWYNGTLIEDCTMLVDVQPSFSEYETGEESRRFSTQHSMILQKLKLLEEYRSEGHGGMSAHKIIMKGGFRTNHVDTKKLEKPESMRQKEEHFKRHKYPRLHKRKGYYNRRRRLMKFVRA